MNTEHIRIIQSCQDTICVLEKMSPFEQRQKRLFELDERINAPGFWNDPKVASVLMKERSIISDYIDFMNQSKDYISVYAELAQSTDNGPSDKDTTLLLSICSHLHTLVFTEMMKDPVDNTPAIISINAGAGGLEAANWVTMLLRMYIRHADSQGFKIEILDEKPSEEHSSICTDSVSIRVEGPYAFGYFKSESGVHRLIRNSPFNAANARQTSFAAVQVTPDIEDTIDIKIEDKDIDVTTMRGSGPGGQAINKIESAVRIKHLPTGLVINSRAERSQHDNRRFAMKMLKAKLYDLEVQKKQNKQNQKISDLSDVSFGHQIRTVTMTPYSLVKDHRTNCETNDVNGVLDGDIREFMLSFLQQLASAP